LESPESVCVIDDSLARRIAGALGLRFTGTLGILLDAKRAGITTSVRPGCSINFKASDSG